MPKMATKQPDGLSAEHHSDLMSEDSHRHDADSAAPRHYTPDKKMTARRTPRQCWLTISDVQNSCLARRAGHSCVQVANAYSDQHKQISGRVLALVRTLADDRLES